jgi:hypothetical protein
MGAENGSPNCPAHRESLYRLSYSSPLFEQLCWYLNFAAWLMKNILFTKNDKIMKQTTFCGDKRGKAECLKMQKITLLPKYLKTTNFQECFF